MIFTTPLKKDSIKIMLLGSGELGKEVALEAQRMGIEVVAVDKYEHAPAHLVSNRSYVIDMKDKKELLSVIKKEKPTFILPEVEAINIDALFEAEKLGFSVIPNAKAVSLTMNRRGIREFASLECGVKTSGYKFVKTLKQLEIAATEIGFPCVIKPVMSSSGHGQSICRGKEDIKQCFENAKEARGDASELIVEEFIPFDYEITLLTINNGKEITFCEPIGHIQKDGDYIFSWQPMEMKKSILKKAKEIASKVVIKLDGKGIFGVELFIKGEDVYFSEVSPRPHDTGMVTMITQNFSEFALHMRAILGLKAEVKLLESGASAAYKAKSENKNFKLQLPEEIFEKDCDFRIFGKPESHIGRRMAIALVSAKTSEKALKKAKKIIQKFKEV